MENEKIVSNNLIKKEIIRKNGLLTAGLILMIVFAIILIPYTVVGGMFSGFTDSGDFDDDSTIIIAIAYMTIGGVLELLTLVISSVAVGRRKALAKRTIIASAIFAFLTFGFLTTWVLFLNPVAGEILFFLSLPAMIGGVMSIIGTYKPHKVIVKTKVTKSGSKEVENVTEEIVEVVDNKTTVSEKVTDKKVVKTKETNKTEDKKQTNNKVSEPKQEKNDSKKTNKDSNKKEEGLLGKLKDKFKWE